MTPLRAYRKANGLTLGQVAPKLGVSESQLSRIERVGTPKLKLAMDMAALTEQPIEQFLKADAA